MDRSTFTFAVACGLIISLAGIAYEVYYDHDIVMAIIFVVMGISFLLYYFLERNRYRSKEK